MLETVQDPGNIGTVLRTAKALGIDGVILTGSCADIYSPKAVRSSMGIRRGITLSNAIGVIDSDYRGEVKVGLINQSAEPYTIQPGERIAQLCIAPVWQAAFVESAQLSDTARGAGGFGSTGKQ